MEFRVLGPLQVLDGGVPVEITGAKQQAVLGLLILRANEVVGSERLIEGLWGDRPPRNAAAALYNHVSRLRKALGPELLARREWGYVLRTPPESIDLRCFEGMISEADQLPAKERAAKLTEALALWYGSPLAGLESEVALQLEIARLAELRVETIERRIDADLEAGRNSDLVGELEMMIAEQPLREHLRWQLILSLYRAGRQAEALEVYRETRRVLAEELGLDPSVELRELERAILRQDPSLELGTTRLRHAPIGIEPTSRARARWRRWLPTGLVVALGLGFVGATALALVLVNAGTDRVAEHETVIVNRPQRTTPVRPTATVGHPHSRNHRTKSVKRKQAATTPPSISVTPTRPTTPPTSNTRPARSAGPSTTTNEMTPRPTSTTPKASTTTTPTARLPPPKLVTISDTFDGDLLDPLIWGGIWRTDDNVSIAEAGGQLQITVGAQAQPLLEHLPAGDRSSIDIHVGTTCTFPGDFDARIDYKLLEWPLGDGVFAQLNSAGAGGAVGRESLPAGEEYEGWIYPSGSVGSVSLLDTSGSLRIARVNTVETAYLLHLGSWVALARGYSKGEAIPVLGMMTSDAPERPFGHAEAKVAFDNFIVAGANPNCPPGSAPP